jgi:HlyD family secretion protein
MGEPFLTAQYRSRLVWLLIIIGIAGIAAASVVFVRPYFGVPQQTPVITPVQRESGVSCLGRIEPEDRIVTIGARSISGQPSLVKQLHVKEGDDIGAGQVVAVLDSREQLEAALRQAEARVKVAQTRRDQVTARPKNADIAAEEVEIARLEVELANARTEFARTENLFKQGIVSQAVMDQSRLAIDTKPQLIAAAKERLHSLMEVRQVDIDVAQAELEEAIANARRAQSEADAATIRSPYSGRVVKILAYQGEEVGSQGILELARVQRMYVIAEVAEGDVPRVKPGQRATITGSGLSHGLEGSVEQLGFKVAKNSMAAHDPLNLTDARIVEVKVLLDDGSSVKNLIGAQVEVLIRP